MIRRRARGGCGCGGRSEVRGGIGHPGRVGGDSLRSEVAVFPGCLQIAKRGKRGLAAQRLRLGLGGEPADREPGPRIGFNLRPIARERLDEIVVTAECLLCLGEFLQVPPVSLVSTGRGRIRCRSEAVSFADAGDVCVRHRAWKTVLSRAEPGDATARVGRRAEGRPGP